MPKTYTIRLNSNDKLSGTNNNATYNINLSNILPNDVEYWKVQMYLSTATGYYLDSIDTAVTGFITDFGKAYVLMNCSTKALGVDAKTNGATSYLGMANRIQTTQNINNDAVVVRGTNLAYFYADNTISPPVTIRRPTDALLELQFLKPYLNDLLTDTDDDGLSAADMTQYFMILSFEACYDN